MKQPRAHNDYMSSAALTNSQSVLRRIVWIQGITIGWMVVEAAVSLSVAWCAHSPALLAFGGDSAIELLSATVVYWRFGTKGNGKLTETVCCENRGRSAIRVSGLRSPHRFIGVAWTS